MITNINPDYRYLQDFAFVFEMSVILHILLVTTDRLDIIPIPLTSFSDLDLLH